MIDAKDFLVTYTQKKRLQRSMLYTSNNTSFMSIQSVLEKSTKQTDDKRLFFFSFKR